jgi:CAP-Gly domain-containing linker protein 1
MPPPASPAGGSRSISLNDQLEGDASPSELESSGRTLQDKLSRLVLGSATSNGSISPRPGSSISVNSPADADYHAHIERLQSRLDALEYENERLQSVPKTLPDDLEAARRAEAMEAERDQERSRISQLEAQIKTTERSLNERDSKVDSLQRVVQQMTADLDAKRNDSESRLRDLQSKLDDSVVLVQNLKEALEAKEGRENENNAILKAKNAEVALLQSRVEKAYVELENERRELGAQVGELREAGQVCCLPMVCAVLLRC